MAERLIVGSGVTEYGIKARTSSSYSFRVTSLGGSGEIYGLICPSCGREHLAPGKLQHANVSGRNVVLFNSLFCPSSGTHYDVRDEGIYMDASDAARYGM